MLFPYGTLYSATHKRKTQEVFVGRSMQNFVINRVELIATTDCPKKATVFSLILVRWLGFEKACLKQRQGKRLRDVSHRSLPQKGYLVHKPSHVKTIALEGNESVSSDIKFGTSVITLRATLDPVVMLYFSAIIFDLFESTSSHICHNIETRPSF